MSAASSASLFTLFNAIARRAWPVNDPSRVALVVDAEAAAGIHGRGFLVLQCPRANGVRNRRVAQPRRIARRVRALKLEARQVAAAFVTGRR